MFVKRSLVLTSQILLGIAFLVPLTLSANNDFSCQSTQCQSDFRKLERMARHGSGEAATLVAVAYANGEGVSVDEVKARRHLRQGVRWREPMAVYQMSVWLRHGIVFEVDLAEADRRLLQAAKLNYGPAIVDVAKQLLQQNTEAADAEAVSWLHKAEDLSYLPGIYLLAKLYASGTAVESDLALAGELFKRLALRNYLDSRHYLTQIISFLQETKPLLDDDLLPETEAVLASLQEIDDIEVIQVHGQKFSPDSTLSFMVTTLDNKNLYRPGGTGSRIPGNICGRGTSMCRSIQIAGDESKGTGEFFRVIN